MGKILIIKGADFSEVAVAVTNVELTPIWSNAHGFFYAETNKWYLHGCAAATGYNVTTGQIVKVSILNNTQRNTTSGESPHDRLIGFKHYAIATKNGTQKPEGSEEGVDVGFIKAYKTLNANTAPVQGSETYSITEDGVLVVLHYDDQNIKVELLP